MDDLYENTVRFAETDAQGIVFYGTYVTYQDETFTEYMDAVGFPYEQLRADDWDVHVVNLELDFRSQATFRDRLVNAMRIDAIGESSLAFEYRCRQADDEALVVEGSVTHVAVDQEGSPIRVPDAFRDAVISFQETAPDPV
jgi:acyl-CoA thioester hydrolase